ncbi:hypothetical protein BALAC2494_01934 [Bifidobacterium animalis subsp. lactis CNCM I-2494]|uniref:Uncharacterized protein n=1 Tax=Bifidobacterium animalis subsp. lactis CNCM I-2494 TaxID=1042403 RepID=A0A806FIE4_BIFAN|nr:hypothetical protein BALAC2494_01934 [Bifidobacterium animalis subsp. lactis CNCM I-2494]
MGRHWLAVDHCFEIAWITWTREDSRYWFAQIPPECVCSWEWDRSRSNFLGLEGDFKPA